MLQHDELTTRAALCDCTRLQPPSWSAAVLRMLPYRRASQLRALTPLLLLLWLPLLLLQQLLLTSGWAGS
jgi:hypothetical protein